MKKLILFVAVAVISLASCKKDRTCTCTTTSSVGGPSEVQVYNFTKAKKSDARAQCLSYTEQHTGYTKTRTCELN